MMRRQAYRGTDAQLVYVSHTIYAYTTYLDEPYGQNLHLFHHQDELRAINAALNLCTGELGNILSRRDEIAVCLHKLRHYSYEDGVCDLNHGSADIHLDSF
jgi:hypothetical protein